MILFAIGLPGRFAELCDGILTRLAALTGGEVVCSTFPPLKDMFGYEEIPPTLDELGRQLIASDAAHLVIGARQPDETLRRTLAERNTRFVVVLDDPRNAVADIVAETGADDFKLVVRAVANSCPLVMQTARLPGALTIHAERVYSDPEGMIAAIAAHFGIDAAPQEVAGIAADLVPSVAGTASSGETLPAGARSMCDGALIGYRDQFRDGNLSQLVWTREFFLAGEGDSPFEPIDVSGPARILIFGPYIQLPAGAWTAQVVLGVSAEAAARTFLVDALTNGVQIAATTFRPEIAGIHRAELTFSVGEPAGRGVEVRVCLVDNDGRGQMAFGQVVLRPIAIRHVDPGAPAAEDFTVVLGL